MCLFCKIVAGEIPAKKVYEDENVVGFLDIHPVAPTHVLFIPKQHVKDIYEASAVPALIENIFFAIRKWLDQKGIQEGFRVVSNCGSSAGQSVFHLHFHVIGGRNLQWPPG